MFLKDKVIIVTGAAGGLGREFSMKIAQEGAKVVCADIADASETVRLIEESGNEAICVSVDITDYKKIQAMCQAAEDAFGGIDGIVNNAAIYAGISMEPFHLVEEDEWDRVINVNLIRA